MNVEPIRAFAQSQIETRFSFLWPITFFNDSLTDGHYRIVYLTEDLTCTIIGEITNVDDPSSPLVIFNIGTVAKGKSKVFSCSIEQ